jgi:hypothetical protein
VTSENIHYLVAGEEDWEDAAERAWGTEAPPRKGLSEKPLAEKSTNLPAGPVEKRGPHLGEGNGARPGEEQGPESWQGMMWGKPHRALGGKIHESPYPSPGYTPAESPVTVLPRRQLRDKKGGEKGADGETPQMFTRRMARARGADMSTVSLGKFLAKATSPANSPTKPAK